MIFLDQVQPRQRHVELRVVRIAQEHEFAGRAFDRHLAQALELADAVVHVHHVIAGLEVRKIAEEARRLRRGNAGARAAEAFRRDRRCRRARAALRETRRLRLSGAFTSTIAGAAAAAAFFREARDRGVFFELAQAVGQFVFVADVGEALEFARARGGNHHVLARRKPPAHFGHERGHVAVIARGRLRSQRERSGALGRDRQMLDARGAEKAEARATIPLR